jgi:UDP-N-acetylmuramyl pentapeptide synthase
MGAESLPDLAGMLASLNYLKISDAADRRTTLDDFKKSYREERIQDQIEYFSRNATRSDQKARNYKATVTSAVILALCANLWMLLGSFWLKKYFGTNWLTALAFAGTVCFQIATVAGALLVVNDWRRRRERYRELHDLLVIWDKQIASARTWPILLRIATRVERALLVEVLEWRSLIRNRKLPRK